MDQMAIENCNILSAKESLRTLEGMIYRQGFSPPSFYQKSIGENQGRCFILETRRRQERSVAFKKLVIRARVM